MWGGLLCAVCFAFLSCLSVHGKFQPAASGISQFAFGVTSESWVDLKFIACTAGMNKMKRPYLHYQYSGSKLR
jgi:hypothetical protein